MRDSALTCPGSEAPSLVSNLLINAYFYNDWSSEPPRIRSNRNTIQLQFYFQDSWIRLTNSDFLQRTSLTPEKLDCDPGETVYLISPVALNRRMQRVSSPSKKKENEPRHKAVQTQTKQRSPDVILLERDEVSTASPKTLTLSRENLLTRPSTSRAVSSAHGNASCSGVPRKTLSLFNEDVYKQPSARKTVPTALTNFTRGDKVKKRVTFGIASPKSKTTSSQCNLVVHHSKTRPETNSREEPASAQDALCSDFSITRDFLNNGLKGNNERPLNSEYCKLANVRKKMKVRVFGIIMRILEVCYWKIESISLLSETLRIVLCVETTLKYATELEYQL